MKATMIAVGGLSGGISSAIAGGSFWKGFQQGLITSGLNHVAHMVSDQFDKSNFEKLKKQVEKVAGDAYAKFSGKAEDLVKLVREVPILNELFMKNKQGTDVWFKIKNIGKDANNPTQAITSPNGNGGSTVEFWWDTADTWIGTAVTLGHELIHVMNESLGMHSMWRGFVSSRSQDYARANSEAAAYSWSASYAGSGGEYNQYIQASNNWLKQAFSLYDQYKR